MFSALLPREQGRTLRKLRTLVARLEKLDCALLSSLGGLELVHGTRSAEPASLSELELCRRHCCPRDNACCVPDDTEPNHFHVSGITLKSPATRPSARNRLSAR